MRRHVPAIEEAAMNGKTSGKTSGKQGPRRAAALAVLAASGLLVTACGVVHVHFGAAAGNPSAAAVTYREDLAYAQCMRAHGVPGFPNPSPSGHSSFSGHLLGNPDSTTVRANAACKHLLAPLRQLTRRRAASRLYFLFSGTKGRAR
jgi:hypothetical protein